MLVSSVLGNSQRLDGGAMFGNAPKALWSRWLEPDAENRVPLVCRALLVEDAGRRVLLETGIGAFFEPKLKERYGVVEPEHVLLDSLEGLGTNHAEIDVVVLSHLHFDHAGGLLAPYREGAPPSLLFPKARYLVGQTAFERAASPHPRDRASFIPGLVDLLRASGRLEVVPDGATASDTLGPAFRFVRSDGHTPGMLLTEVRGAAHGVIFCADLVPGTAWVHLPITMGYDRFPERLIEEKTLLFERLMTEGTDLFFTHDPAVAATGLAQDDRGRYTVRDQRAELVRWNLDVN